jgi:hypothetical protein
MLERPSRRGRLLTRPRPRARLTYRWRRVSTPTGVIADSPVEPPVAAGVGTVEAPPPVVIPDLSVLDQEEGVAVVAEVGDQRPANLAEEGPSTSTVVAPDALAAGGPDALVEGRAEP